MNRTLLSLLGLAVLAALAALPFIMRGPAIGDDAAPSGNAARGKVLVAEACAACHSIEQGVDSPVPDAPAFSTLAQNWPLNYLEEALAEGIMVGHETYQMPVFQFQPEEIQDIIAYLETIQEPADAE